MDFVGISSCALADSRAGEDERIHVLHRKEKNGLGPAYLAGFSWALASGYELIVEMDADGSHRAEDLALLVQRAQIADEPDLAFYPLPESAYADMKAFGDKPIGNGPYTLSSWEHDSRAVLAKNQRSSIT